ncbi:MAG: ATP-binding domain-containing protein [Proteobacteria bacterium]|nr:ATP-binding domain-containing protein [Pseudomonadota bacterium]
MIDLIFGTQNKSIQSIELANILRSVFEEGTLYIGYPILVTPDDKTTIDAVFISQKCGLVIFDILDDLPNQSNLNSFWAQRAEKQNELILGVTSKLLVHKGLTKRGGLAFKINVVTFGPNNIPDPNHEDIVFATPSNLNDAVNSLPSFDGKYLLEINSAIERVANIKPRNKRNNVVKSNSKGAIIKALEHEIANLDRWQKRGAIESPDGPQRVRGLAGSGKTIVLALKAAYLHAQHPEWDIVITFQTRALKEQFQDLIRRFTFEHLNDEPDWSKIRILPAWGSLKDPGIYSEICRANGIIPKTFEQAGRDFTTAASELLSTTSQGEGIFDAVLIDEAQDFPPAFFQLVYKHTRHPKRVIWAYDELQNLSDATMPQLSALFGLKPDGSNIVSLKNEPGLPVQDLILPKCYRNPPWSLVAAHALGFGVYSQHGVIQMFDDNRLWEEIGYEIVSGALTPGQHVSLQRKPNATPQFFKDFLTPEESFQTKLFSNQQEQAKFVANQIKENISIDELEPTDILVIFTNPVSARSEAGLLMAELRELGIQSHLAGVTNDRNQFYMPGSVAITGIYRAKGNEAPMVYVLNCDYCTNGPNLLKKRNILFTAITRSRSWVRLCGVGTEASALFKEIELVKTNEYKLSFKTPTAEELAKLRSINRDKSVDEIKAAENAKGTFAYILQSFEDGIINRQDIAQADLERLLAALGLGGKSK